MKQREKKARLVSIVLFSRSLLEEQNSTLLCDTFQQTSAVTKHATKEIDDEVKYVDTRSCLIVLETSN